MNPVYIYIHIYTEKSVLYLSVSPCSDSSAIDSILIAPSRIAHILFRVLSFYAKIQIYSISRAQNQRKYYLKEGYLMAQDFGIHQMCRNNPMNVDTFISFSSILSQSRACKKTHSP